jgi:hypothetical protein
MSDEAPREDEQDGDDGGGEPGREEVAGARGGQPGYDLDEAEAYEEAAEEEER